MRLLCWGLWGGHIGHAEPCCLYMCVKAYWEPCQVGNATLAVFVVFLLYGHMYFCWPSFTVWCSFGCTSFALQAAQQVHRCAASILVPLHSSWRMVIVHLLSHLLNERHGCCCCSSKLCVMHPCVHYQPVAAPHTRRGLAAVLHSLDPLFLRRQSWQSWHGRGTAEAAQ